MRKYMTVLLAALLLSAPVYAHADQSNDTVTIKKSDLTDDQRKKIEQQSSSGQAFDVKDPHTWNGIGHEIGDAVNESLSAVTTQANNFANTKVGKWTIFLVIYKVAGKELVNYVIGISMLTFGGLIWLWVFYRNCIGRRVLVKDSKETGKEWKVINDSGNDPKHELRYSRLIHAAAMLLLIIIASITMYGCQ